MVELGERAASVEPVPAAKALGLRDVVRTWWPLAMSWLFMGIELPALNAVIARLPNPEINLAAFGAIVFPIALLIEGPIIMLLAAGTALARDRQSFEALARFTRRLAIGCTVVHAACAFTPLYDLLIVPLIDAPAEIVEPGRIGLQLTTFWTWCVADRRFRQGVLIRHGRPRAVTIGTFIRLIGTASGMAAGVLVGLSGVASAALAWSVGVFVEMLFVRWAVAPVVREDVMSAPAQPEPLTARRLTHFYVPLALTPFLTLAAHPIGAAAISRMPDALPSLAVWSVMHTTIFMFRSVGMAFNEVVVSHAGVPGAGRTLKRFGILLSVVLAVILTLLSLTPVVEPWFAVLFDLPPELVGLASGVLWLGIALPVLTVAHSLYQGILVHAGRTRGVTEAVAIYLVVCTVGLIVGVMVGSWNGCAVALVAMTLGGLAQAVWLGVWVRRLPPGSVG